MKCVSSVAGRERRVARARASRKSRLVRHAGDAEPRAARCASRAIASARVGAVRDHLREHRIVVDADLGARLDAARRSARPAAPPAPRAAIRAGRGQEVARGILGVEPRLDRVAVERARRPARTAAARPRATSICEPHEVEARHHLGHRMLDLEARVHLEEVELAVRRRARTRPCRRRRSRSPAPAATAAAPMRARSAASTAGDGASSMIFW